MNVEKLSLFKCGVKEISRNLRKAAFQEASTKKKSKKTKNL